MLNLNLPSLSSGELFMTTLLAHSENEEFWVPERRFNGVFMIGDSTLLSRLILGWNIPTLLENFRFIDFWAFMERFFSSSNFLRCKINSWTHLYLGAKELIILFEIKSQYFYLILGELWNAGLSHSNLTWLNSGCRASWSVFNWRTRSSRECSSLEF